LFHTRCRSEARHRKPNDQLTRGTATLGLAVRQLALFLGGRRFSGDITADQ
jgi:hypothetical protein